MRAVAAFPSDTLHFTNGYKQKKKIIPASIKILYFFFFFSLLSELRDRGDLFRILHRSAVKVMSASLFYEPCSTILVVSLQLKGLHIISIRFNGEEGSHWELKKCLLFAPQMSCCSCASH